MITIDEIAEFCEWPAEHSMEEWKELRKRIDEEFNEAHGVSKEDMDRYGDYEEMVLMITSDD